MSAGRALLRVIRRQGSKNAPTHEPPVFWGRLGAYEAVTRHGILLLLSPEAAHPSRRVGAIPAFSTDVDARPGAGS